jgi:hypothetical protein
VSFIISRLCISFIGIILVVTYRWEIETLLENLEYLKGGYLPIYTDENISFTDVNFLSFIIYYNNIFFN